MQSCVKPAHDTLPLRAAGLLEYGVGGELILCAPDVEEVHFLNATAAAIWLLCDGHHAVPDIAAELAALFELDLPAAESDVRETLADLLKARLLQASPAHHSGA
jgi:hypothetical protein